MSDSCSAHPAHGQGNQVPRDFAAVVWELKVVFSLADERPLLEWQLGEVSTAKPEQRSQQWWLGLAELARDLRKQLADHSKTLVRNFMRWSDSKMDSKRKPGIAFLDCHCPSTPTHINGRYFPVCCKSNA